MSGDGCDGQTGPCTCGYSNAVTYSPDNVAEGAHWVTTSSTGPIQEDFSELRQQSYYAAMQYLAGTQPTIEGLIDTAKRLEKYFREGE